MFNWFKKKKPKHDGGMQVLKEAIQKKQEVADKILRKRPIIDFDRRFHDVPFEGEDRRFQEA